MTVWEAYQILGIPAKTGKKEIKKRYRQLMMQVHPDAGRASEESCGRSAQEINIAYAVLMKERPSDRKETSYKREHRTAAGRKNAAWDAPVNADAFSEREILQYVEAYDGTVLGNYCLTQGKYLWKTEEDFPLFLLSLYKCGKELLDGIDEEADREDVLRKRQRIQAELTYLLAQQFIDGSVLLAELVKKEIRNGIETFYLSAMLELTAGAASVKAGETIYPSGIRNHKLYLKNQNGQTLGYLSFPDDRLYYIVIPLFEQRRALVRIQAAEREAGDRRKGSAGYQNLHLWIRLPETDISRLPENLNLQIEGLLEEYKRYVRNR